MAYKFVEPLREHQLTFTMINECDLVIPKIQREVSEAHVKKLTDSIIKLGFIEPIIVIPSEEEGKYEIINGQHRYLAGKRLGMTKFPSIILPKELRDYIIYLNIEKAPSVRDKSHQAKEIFNTYLDKNPDMIETELEAFIEKPYYITIGIVMEDLEDMKFPASVFERFLSRFDNIFLSVSLTEAYKERLKRAEKLLEAKKVLNEKYTELGLNNPYLKSAIISKAIQMEWGRMRKIYDDFHTAINKLIENIKKVEFLETDEELELE